jgi:rfaE bifunctional protein nucleotidyltransferase chain/domain
MNPIPEKLLDFTAACEAREQLRASGKSVVLTNGCFDLLHVGHVFSLKNAKKFGDSLWVAMNSDGSVRALKGPKRPIFKERERAYVLSALEVVGGIFIFNGAELADEILKFRPDVYVKSADYCEKTLNPLEREALRCAGAEVKFVPFLGGVSTTSTIGKILQ